MSKRSIRRPWKDWVVFFVIVLVPCGVAAQEGVEAKLMQRADFAPAPGTIPQQLVQIAQHYKLPMGIEWVLQTEEKLVKPVVHQSSTVRALLNSILEAAPQYSMTLRNGVVNVSARRYAVDSRNFLNLRIAEFGVTNSNVFDATAELRFKIRATLHPERFVGGTNGGQGYGVPDENGLDVPNVSFSGRGMSVRDILNRIVLSNGNTLWVVNIAPSRMMRNEPYFAQFDTNHERDFVWTIIPFNKSTQK
jgi:hypothetical protein